MRQTIISNNEEPKFSGQQTKINQKKSSGMFWKIQTAQGFGRLKITELGL